MAMKNGMQRTMNYSEAMRRARDLWGAAADVERRRDVAPELQCVVGTKGAAPGQRAYGTGRTFEAAFEDAARGGAL